MSPAEEIKREGCEVKGVGKYLTMSFYDFCYVMGMDPEMGFDFCSQEDASEGVSFDGGLIF